MDWREFAASVIGDVVSWPVAVVVVAIIFRSQLRALVGRLRRVEVGGQTFDFEAELDLAENLAKAAGPGSSEDVPASAPSPPAPAEPVAEVLLAWNRVENAVAELYRATVSDEQSQRPRPARMLAFALVERGVVNSNYAETVASLSRLRNAVAHAVERPTPDEARQFAQTAKEIVEVSNFVVARARMP